MTKLATLWVGDLGPIELASLASFARHGQKVVIYSYGKPKNVPDGFDNRDANEVLPSDRVAMYAKERSPSLHSNMFRYHLQALTDYTWVDLDIIARRPFHFDGDYAVGWQYAGTLINCAVLRLPAESPALRDLLVFRPGYRGYPPHVRGLRRAKYWVRTAGRGLPIENWIWGATGPKALTVCMERHDETRHALPVEAFYPIPVKDTVRFVTPGALSDESFGDETFGVHLSKSVLERALISDFDGRLPAGSYLHKQIEKARADGFDAGDLQL